MRLTMLRRCFSFKDTIMNCVFLNFWNLSFQKIFMLSLLSSLGKTIVARNTMNINFWFQLPLSAKLAQDVDRIILRVTSADVCEGVRTLTQAISFLAKVMFTFHIIAVSNVFSLLSNILEFPIFFECLTSNHSSRQMMILCVVTWGVFMNPSTDNCRRFYFSRF